MATSVLLFVIVIKRNNLDAINPIADIIAAVILLLCLIGVTLRFGLVALIVAFFMINTAGSAPLTLDASKLYAGPVWFIGVVVLALCAAGYWMATGAGAGQREARTQHDRRGTGPRGCIVRDRFQEDVWRRPRIR